MSHALTAFTQICDTAREMATASVRKNTEQAAMAAALDALDAAAIALVPVLPCKGKAQQDAYTTAAHSLRPAIMGALPVQSMGFFNLLQGGTIAHNFALHASPTHLAQVAARGGNLRHVHPDLMVRVLDRHDPEMEQFLHTILPHTPDLDWIFKVVRRNLRNPAFLQSYLPAALRAHPGQAADLARRAASSYEGEVVTLLLMAGLPIPTLLAQSMPDMARAKLTGLSAHKLLTLFPTNGAMAELWTNPAARKRAKDLMDIKI